MFEVVGYVDDASQVVPMYDKPSDLSSLVKALYDGVNSDLEDPMDFFQLAGVLRLSTKYCATRIRVQTIRLLLKTWSSTLEGHDEMVKKALLAPIANNLTYPYVHPLHVLNLAHETDVQVIRPSALYFLSVYQLSEVLEGGHPKLMVEHPSKPSSELSLGDIRDYTLVYQFRINAALDFIRNFCRDLATSPRCGAIETCGRQFGLMVTRLHNKWQPKTGPLFFMYQVIEQTRHAQSICALCRSHFHVEAQKQRQENWNMLPAVAGFSSWEELEERDLKG
ncbi:hypothetical protein FA15DRAFT_585297 [Coprinopsis marcescibilis]|uniref:BTB domain-containing protein n=1 Tax=Coprinopsis marcescibilis TaxID=230819 RepID=A0A5C3L4L4_COPMA|nr:hypothetical protein FA15DRAFT_585297 [Coprinopsis marcescibilis]